jgi:hypothetical protein
MRLARIFLMLSVYRHVFNLSVFNKIELSAGVGVRSITSYLESHGSDLRH